MLIEIVPKDFQAIHYGDSKRESNWVDRKCFWTFSWLSVNLSNDSSDTYGRSENEIGEINSKVAYSINLSIKPIAVHC